MERQPQLRLKKKDRTGVYISIALHVMAVGLILYFVSKTELGQQILHTIGGSRTKETKERAKPPAAQARPKDSLKPPPGAPPPSGARRTADAPAAVGEGFFAEERTKTKGDSGAGRGGPTNIVVAAPPPPVL